MIGLALAVVLLVDGGGSYAPVSDYEWPGSSTSPILIQNDSLNGVLADGGWPIGAQTLRNYDGGILLDERGLYFVRGPTNVWANIHTWGLGWGDTDNGGKYEVCFTPSWNSDEWTNGQNPDWNGTNYLLDVNMVSQHTVTFILGSGRPANLYIRLTGAGSTTLDLDAGWTKGQAYCAAVEWVPAVSGCDAWVRYDSCALTPVPLCVASTIVGYETGGACPSPSPTYITLAQRQYGYDVTDLAPTTVHVSALRESVK